MNIQKKILLGLVVVWVILLILFGLARSGFLVRGKVDVYLFQKQFSGSWLLVPVKRQLKGLTPDVSKKIHYAIEQLIAGPQPEEAAESFISCVPVETNLLNVRIDNDIIYLDFDETVETGGGIEEIKGRLAQIVYTATQFNPEKGVKILINGKEIKSFSGEGLTEVEKPLYRNGFSDFTKGEK